MHVFNDVITYDKVEVILWQAWFGFLERRLQDRGQSSTSDGGGLCRLYPPFLLDIR